MTEFTRRRLLATSAVGASSAWLLALAGPQAGPALAAVGLPAEDGHDLWLRYRRVRDAARLDEYRSLIHDVVRPRGSAVLGSAFEEIVPGLSGLLGRQVKVVNSPERNGTVVLGTPQSSAVVAAAIPAADLAAQGPEGFVIRWVRVRNQTLLVIASTGDRGVLYGAFALLRVLQTHGRLTGLSVDDRPTNPMRLLNHWDNITDTVERGYAGSSIFEWSVPGLSPLVHDYARSLASVGINRAVVNNVNASPQFLTPAMLDEVALVADALRPWGVQLMLSANFASPLVLGRLGTADPLDARVRAWWLDKATEVYAKIPDFGGFLVKANSEGQPGPTDYGRTHADGANVIARGVAPHGGVVVWRAFVYDLSDGDVSTDAYETFKPLDGQFDDNVAVQAKYGPVDFHVREPVHPLIGAMRETNMTLELQVTQEHVGHSTHLCYLVPWWKQVLDFDTYANGAGTTVADVVDGSAFGHRNAGMSGVSNFGAERDWTGHQLAAANSYGYGRLAWDPSLTPERITDEWVRMTFGSEPVLRETLSAMLLGSWKTFEDYTSPLGIGNMVAGFGDHFDPDPEDNRRHADGEGCGNDRTVATGTGYTALYQGPWPATYENRATCPDELILFMHRVPYGHVLHSGKTVIQHIYDSHFTGLDAAKTEHDSWDRLISYVDPARHPEVAERFDAQVDHATLWRDTIVAYFFRLSRVLDAHRSWVQVRPAGTGGALVLGGYPNTLPLEVGNASPGQLVVTAAVSAPDGWVARPVDVTVSSTEFAVADLPVTPPTQGLIATVDADIDAGGLPVLGGSDVTLVVTPAAVRCVHALDAGSASSPVLEGYSRLAPETAWDPSRGFGWVGGAPQQRDRGAALDVLRRDFCADTRARTLRVGLPAGTFRTYLLVGDVVGSYPTIVTVDGAEVARSRQLGGNEFEWLAFDLHGGSSGREVDLALSSVSGQYWHFGALAVVDPAAELEPVLITGTSPSEPLLLPDRPAEVTVDLANTTDRARTVSVEASAPTGYTAAVEPTSVTLPAEGTGQVTVTITRQAGTGDGTLTLKVGGLTHALALQANDNWARIATMSASSTHSVSSPTHVNDGITDSEQWTNARGGWNDGTPSEFPDTLTATWDQQVPLSRVRVYTLDSSAYPSSAYGIRDYDVETQGAAGWTAVASVRGNTAGMVESTFAAVETTAVRLVIHDSNDHAYSRVMEVEAYT